MYSYEFTIPSLPPTTNSQGRSHWAVKAKTAREWKDAVIVMTRRHLPLEPLPKAKITLTRHSSMPLDADGLVSSFKHILDGLVFAKVILDDRFNVIGMPKYDWKRAPRGKGFITVRIEELSNEENICDNFVSDGG